MSNVLAFTKIELIKYTRQPLVIAFGVLFPVFWVIMNGTIFKNYPSEILGGYGTVDFMLPAFIFMIILVTGLSSLPLVLAKNYETKVIKRYSFTPVKKYQYLMALYLGNFVAVVIPTIIMFVVAYLIYDIRIPSIFNILLLFIVMFFISIVISSFGIFIASIVKGFQSTLSVSLLIYFILLFISGCTVPMPVLPDVIRNISSYIPFSKMVLLLQNIWLENTVDIVSNIIITVVSLITLFTLASISFKWSNE